MLTITDQEILRQAFSVPGMYGPDSRSVDQIAERLRNEKTKAIWAAFVAYYEENEEAKEREARDA